MQEDNLLNNRYEIIGELGRKPSQKTFQALDRETEENVVIKLLFLGKDFDWQDLKLFEREAEILKKIHHPAIPQYLDFFELEMEDDKGFGLVQTYVEAQSLEAQLKQGRRFSESEVIQLAKSMLEILDYLHQQKPAIIHRDIKPSNILVTNRSGHSVGEVYLVDFGSVQNIAAQEGGTITVVGTYGYMPPEQFGGRAKPASDLYSLGATLIYLITGLHPTELPQKDLCIQFRHLADITQQLGDWLEWMTEPALDKRFTSAKIALEAIENPPIRISKGIKNLSKTTQPPGSKIQLIKTKEYLEIILPPTGFGIGLIALLSCIIPFALGSSFLFFWNIINQNLTLKLLIVLLQIGAIAFLFFLVLSALYKRTRLIFNENNLYIINELFGRKLSKKQIPIASLYEIKLIIDVYNTGVQENLLLLADKLASSRKNMDINLDSYTNLSILEREWLAREISDWLDLPIVESKW